MAETKVRTDQRVFGRRLVLGGIDPATAWGDVGAAELRLLPNDANTLSPALFVQSKAGGIDDVIVQVVGSAYIQGNLAVDGFVEPGRFVIPYDTAFPVSPAPVLGDMFYRSDEKKLYVYDDTLAAWQVVGSNTPWHLWSGVTSTTSPAPTELLRFNFNFFSLFPNGFVMQANAWVNGATPPTGVVQLWDVTAATLLADVGSVVSVSNTNVQDGATSALPPNVAHTYALRYNRTGGVGNPGVNLRSVMLRSV